MPNLIGQSLGRYHILEQLGEGGMATVYKAYDTRLERDVAIKVILPGKQQSEKFIKRFEREAKALAQLSHPNIVHLNDYGEQDGLPYLVMEYLPGGTLKKRLEDRQNKPMSWKEAARILVPIAQALHQAHQQKIIHRDVKPSNILLTQSGMPMLSDFGIAKMIESDLTTELTGTGGTIGTPEYMAPEQGLGGKEMDGRADIYSLGVIFYEMVTGRKPYRADTPMAILHKQLSEPLPRPKRFVPDLPAEVEQVLIKALAKDPTNRYQTAEAFAFALLRIAERNISTVPPIRLPAWVIVAAAGIFGLGILVTGTALVVELIHHLFPPTSRTASPVLTEIPTSAESSISKPGSTRVSPLDGMTTIYVPEGSFLMGSDTDIAMTECLKFFNNCQQEWFLPEGPAHTVNVAAYWIDRTEITNGMYALCIHAGACEPPHGSNSNTHNGYIGDSSYKNYPVIYVNWFDAQNYCKWANRRLPTEAEWEKAAKGINNSMYPWGNDAPKPNLLNFKSIIGDTTKVGSYPAGASAYGVLDLAGNVWEWVTDWYGDSYYKSSPFDNPTGPASGSQRVERGGSWAGDEGDVRSAHRGKDAPDWSSYELGFRCVENTVAVTIP